MTPLKQKLTIQQGRTFRLPIRWESEVFAYAPIASITQEAPCRVTTSAAHGIPDGWRAAVVSAKGMLEINAQSTPPGESEYRVATSVSANQVEFNALNSSDFSAYTSGGYLQYRVPVDITGYTARMTVKDKVGGNELLALTSGNGLVIDQAKKTISIVISAITTAGFGWKSGVYDLELVSPSGDVFALMTGSAVVSQEVTT